MFYVLRKSWALNFKKGFGRCLMLQIYKSMSVEILNPSTSMHYRDNRPLWITNMGHFVELIDSIIILLFSCLIYHCHLCNTSYQVIQSNVPSNSRVSTVILPGDWRLDMGQVRGGLWWWWWRERRHCTGSVHRSGRGEAGTGPLVARWGAGVVVELSSLWSALMWSPHSLPGQHTWSLAYSLCLTSCYVVVNHLFNVALYASNFTLVVVSCLL